METNVLEEFYSSGIDVVGLGAGMKFDGREVEFEEAEVLDDEGVDTNVVELMNHLLGLLKLVVEQ